MRCSEVWLRQVRAGVVAAMWALNLNSCMWVWLWLWLRLWLWLWYGRAPCPHRGVKATCTVWLASRGQ
jgi:hypothetical protein